MPYSLFSKPTFWVCFAFMAFFCLPSQALNYGLFHTTSQEYWQALGWSSINLTWLWFFPLLFFVIPQYNHTSRLYLLGKFTLLILLLFFIFLSAQTMKMTLGYAVFCLIITLIALATQILAQLKYMQGDHFILASVISIILLIGIFIVYPTFTILISMFYDNNTVSLQHILTILEKPYILRIVGNSLSVAFSVGILSTLLGLILALYTTRIAKRSVFISKIFSILPIVTPPFVVGLGVTLMLGRSGYVTAFLVDYFGFPTNWLYGFTGIVIAHTLALTPMAFMILEGALKSLPPTLEEASCTLRATPFQTFCFLTLPLLKPALANAFLVVIIQSLADFSTPLVLGGNFDVIATQIYFAIAGSQLDYTLASTLGSILLLFSLAIFMIQYWWIGQRSYVTVSGKSAQSQLPDLPMFLKFIVIVILGCWVLFNLVLYGSIFYGSFTLNWGVNHQLTFTNYLYLFGRGLDQGGWTSLFQTILFATVSAPIATFLGLLIAYITVRKTFKGRKTLEFLTLLCFAIPGTVAGISYIIAFNTAPVHLTGTSIIIVLSMIMRNMPIGMRSAVASLKQLDNALDEASLSLKANSLKTLCFIIVPLLKSALLSALVTNFVRAMTTVSAIIFLVNADMRVATSYILNRVEDGEYGIAVAYGSTLIIVMITVILFFDWIIGDNHITQTKAKLQKKEK